MKEMTDIEFTGERYVPALSGQIKYEHLHRYALSLELAAGKTVLDIASGEGYGAALLARVARSVTGVDIDPHSVAHARHIYFRPNLSFLVGSCEAVPLPDATVDLVTCFETIEHHDKHEEMMLEIKRVLKPGGKLILSSPNRLTYSDEPGYVNPFHIKELYYDELRELLGQHFKHLRIYGQRIAAGSFIYPLEESSAEALKSFTGDGKEIAREVCHLSSPIYFIAICSDDAAIIEEKISSVYLDSHDDLLKNLDGERLEHISQLQLQLQASQDTFGEVTSAYEAQVSRQTEELLQARAGYEAQITLLQEELSEAQTKIAKQADYLSRLRVVQEKQARKQADYLSRLQAVQEELSQGKTKIARQANDLSKLRVAHQKQLREQAAELARSKERLSRLREQWSKSQEQLDRTHKHLSKTQEDFRRIQEELTGTQMRLSASEAQLQEREELLRHIQSSRSWQMASGLRRLRQRVFQAQELQHKLVSRINVLAEPLFHGALDVPAKGGRTGKYLDIAGWVLSSAAPIARVEASLDGMPLGMLSYGIERPDIAAVYPSDAGQACGYTGRFNLKGFSNGSSVLVVRAWDEQGHQHFFTRSVMIDLPATSAAEMTAAPPDWDQHTTPAQLTAVAEQPAAREVFDNELYRQLENFIARFQTERSYDPSILNWDVDPHLSTAFPHLALFSPPPSDKKSGLPYIDHSIDVVLLASQKARDLEEASRVASVAVINVKSLTSDVSGRPSFDADWSHIELDVVWQENEDNQAGLTRVSIIIPVYNKVAYTDNCLAQLMKTLPDNFEGEIIVVDDASTDNTPAALTRWSHDRRIKVLRNPQNAGFIKSCNRGAEAATREILIFLNNDTLPQPGWLQPLLRVLDEHPDAGAVGGKLIYPDGTLQEAGGVIYSDGSGCNFGRNDSASHAPLYSFLREVDYCSGALLATRRALFMENGGFDTRFAPAYYEDTDYCFSLREKGYKVYYQPESVIIHFEGVSSGTDIKSGVKSYQAINHAKFVDKWKHVLRRRPPAPDRYDFTTLQALAVRDDVVVVTEKSDED